MATGVSAGLEIDIAAGMLRVVADAGAGMGVEIA